MNRSSPQDWSTEFLMLKQKISGVVHDIQLKDLLENKRVLFCSVTRLNDKMTYGYLDYLSDQQERYRSMGIEIVVICSSHGLMPLVQYERRNPTLCCVCDVNNEFVTMLSSLVKKKLDQAFLSKYWNYQALFNNGELEHFAEQPTEDFLKNFVRSGNADVSLIGLISPYLKNDNLLLTLPSVHNIKAVNGNLQRMFFYNIWPNKTLEQHLDNKKAG